MAPSCVMVVTPEIDVPGKGLVRNLLGFKPVKNFVLYLQLFPSQRFPRCFSGAWLMISLVQYMIAGHRFAPKRHFESRYCAAQITF